MTTQAIISIDGQDFLISLKDAATIADTLARAKQIDRRYLGYDYEEENRRTVARGVSVTIRTGSDVPSDAITREEFDRQDAAYRAAKEAAAEAEA